MTSNDHKYYQKQRITRSYFSGCLGSFLLAPTMVFLSKGFYPGILLMIPLILFISFRRGTIINIEKNKIKFFSEYFYFIRIGRWIDISRFNHYKIEKDFKTYRLNSRVNSNTFSDDYFLIELYDKKLEKYRKAALNKQEEIKRFKTQLEMIGIQHRN